MTVDHWGGGTLNLAGTGSAQGDTVSVFADGTVGVNGNTNVAGSVTPGSSTISYTNAGTFNTSGVTGDDQFTVNSWAGGNANIVGAEPPHQTV